MNTSLSKEVQLTSGQKALTRKVRKYHADCGLYFRRAVEYAWLCGRTLNKVKETIPHGQWSAYVQEVLQMDLRTAQRRMEYARELTAEQIRGITTEAEAVALIQASRDPSDTEPEAPSETVKNDRSDVFEMDKAQESQTLVFKKAIEKSVKSCVGAIELYLEANATLLKARALVPHGHWEDYCRNVLGVSPGAVDDQVYVEAREYLASGDRDVLHLVDLAYRLHAAFGHGKAVAAA